MICPACNHPLSRVVDTNHIRGNTITTRRRQCRDCGELYNTHELHAGSYRLRNPEMERMAAIALNELEELLGEFR